MNKKGTTFIYAFMMAVLFFFLGLAFTPPISQVVTESTTGLDCTNSEIAHENKVVCNITDMYAPVFMGLMFGFAAFYITGRTI